MKIYFGASVTGGRELQENYEKLVDFLSSRETVLTSHLGGKKLSDQGENLPASKLFHRDVNWVKGCDVLIADVTIPSTGVGYEIGLAESMEKKLFACTIQKPPKNCRE